MKMKVAHLLGIPHPAPLPRERESEHLCVKQTRELHFPSPLGEGQKAKRFRVRQYAGIAILFIFFFSSCSDDEPLLSITPKIVLKEVTPTTVVQFTDSINMVIEYEDGDGDVGYWNPDSLALTVHDLRLANPDYFYVRPLTPDSNSLAITGSIRIAIRNTFLLGNGDSETTRYEIKLKDRAGHWSNTVTTPEVTITR